MPLTEHQRKIECQILADFEQDVAGLDGESGCGNLNRVAAWKQVREFKQALAIGDCLPHRGGRFGRH